MEKFSGALSPRLLSGQWSQACRYISQPALSGVGVSGAAEAVVHAIQRAVQDGAASEGHLLTLTDFRIAFNSMDVYRMLLEVREHSVLLPYFLVCDGEMLTCTLLASVSLVRHQRSTKAIP